MRPLSHRFILAFILAAATLAVGLFSQLPEAQARTGCNCVPVVTRCGSGKTCKFGGCSPPSPDSNIIGRCATVGSGHHGERPDTLTSAPGPQSSKLKPSRNRK